VELDDNKDKNSIDKDVSKEYPEMSRKSSHLRYKQHDSFTVDNKLKPMESTNVSEVNRKEETLTQSNDDGILDNNISKTKSVKSHKTESRSEVLTSFNRHSDINPEDNLSEDRDKLTQTQDKKVKENLIISSAKQMLKNRLEQTKSSDEVSER